MATRNVIVVGASAGGVEALRTLVGGLPADLPATVLVVLHLPEGGYSALPSILGRSGPLPVAHARDGDKLEYGRIYTAPVDHHLLVADDHLVLGRGPKENGCRPAVDALFRSAARALGPRVIGVVLSGSLDDGTAGLGAVLARGGVGIVQDPGDALYVGMPSSAIAHNPEVHVVPVAGMGELLDRLCREEVEPAEGSPASALMDVEADMAGLDPDAMSRPDRPGEPAGLGCPDCHGALFEIHENDLVRYRCRVGHAWSPQSLIVQQSEVLEGALWMALRALEDKAALCRRLAEPARERGAERSFRHYDQQCTDAELAAGVIRRFLRDGLAVRAGDD